MHVDSGPVSHEAQQLNGVLKDLVCEPTIVTASAAVADTVPRPFDLNIGCECLGDVSDDLNTDGGRVVLGNANGRMNKDCRDHAGHRPSSSRGLVKYIVPLKKSLLCNLMPRLKTANVKKSHAMDALNGPFGRPRTNKSSRSGSERSLDDQATLVLMRATGVVGGPDVPTELDKCKLGEKFVAPLETDLVGGVRTILGLPTDGGTDCLGGLVMAVDGDA